MHREGYAGKNAFSRVGEQRRYGIFCGLVVPNVKRGMAMDQITITSIASRAEGGVVTSAGIAIAERCAHGVDRNARDQASEEEPGDANPDCKCACECLPRHKIAITNRESSDEGELERVANRPALDKSNQETQGYLNRQNCRQDWPRDVNGVTEGHDKVPPHGLWCRPIHAQPISAFRNHNANQAIQR
jgi:hypothetical protein